MFHRHKVHESTPCRLSLDRALWISLRAYKTRRLSPSGRASPPSSWVSPHSRTGTESSWKSWTPTRLSGDKKLLQETHVTRTFLTALSEKHTFRDSSVGLAESCFARASQSCSLSRSVGMPSNLRASSPLPAGNAWKARKGRSPETACLVNVSASTAEEIQRAKHESARLLMQLRVRILEKPTSAAPVTGET